MVGLMCLKGFILAKMMAQMTVLFAITGTFMR